MDSLFCADYPDIDSIYNYNPEPSKLPQSNNNSPVAAPPAN